MPVGLVLAVNHKPRVKESVGKLPQQGATEFSVLITLTHWLDTPPNPATIITTQQLTR